MRLFLSWASSWNPQTFILCISFCSRGGDFRSADKWLADRQGWCEESLPIPETHTTVLPLSPLHPTYQKGSINQETIFASFEALSVANPVPPIPFANLWWLHKIRSLGTTPISGQTLSEWKGHSRNPGSVPGYSRSSSWSSENNSRNAKSHSPSHDLCNVKTTILGAIPGATPGTGGNPYEGELMCPCILGVFSSKIAVARAPDKMQRMALKLEAMSALGVSCWRVLRIVDFTSLWLRDIADLDKRPWSSLSPPDAQLEQEELIYHSFRKLYILNSKAIHSCDCTCRRWLKTPEGIYFI